MQYERQADKRGNFNFSLYTENFHPSPSGEVKVIPHFHNSVEIVAVERGELEIFAGGETRRVCEGEVVYIDKLVPHDVRGGESSDGLRAFVLVIAPTYFTAIKELECGTFDTFLQKSDASYELFELLEWGFSRFLRMSEEMKTGFATMLLGFLVKSYAMRERIGEGRTKLLFGVLEYIDSNYSQRITLEGLALRFGYEKTYLSKIINSSLGMNLREYLNRYRITKVDEKMIKETGSSLLAVAYSCGFESPNTFYRAYKKYSGV